MEYSFSHERKHNRKYVWTKLLLMYKQCHSINTFFPLLVPCKQKVTLEKYIYLNSKSVFIVPHNNKCVCLWFAHIPYWLLISISSILITLNGSCKIHNIYACAQTHAMLKAFTVQCYLNQLITQPESVHTRPMIMNPTVSVWINDCVSLPRGTFRLGHLAQ